MAFSDYVAIFALVISAISLFISWRQYSRDSSQLKLSLQFHVKSGQGSAYTLRVVNSGRRPATVLKCYARLKSGKAYPVYDTPRNLEETDSLEVDIPLYGFKNSITHPLDIVAFEVEETSGRTCRIKTQRIGRDIRKAWTPEVDWLSRP